MKPLPFLLALLVSCGTSPQIQVVKDRAGHVRAEVTRKAGMKDGPVRFFHADGSLETMGLYANDSRHGAWTTVAPSGDTLAIVIYKFGRKHGPQAYWAPNGQLLRYERFVDGEPHGPLYRFYADGTPRQITWYDHGKPEGRHTEWYKVDSTSVGLMTGQFRKGERMGRWTWFYANGKPNRQGNYRNGRQVGIWRYWDPDGRLKNTRNFGSP